MNRSDPDALAGAVAGVRRLIAHLRKTEAPKALLEEVARETAALSERLAEYDHAGPYHQGGLRFEHMAEMAERRTSDPAAFFPYSPVVGPFNAVAPPVGFRLVGDEMHAEHVFDAPYNGPPTAVHGGMIALVFDELLGCLGAMREVGGFTGTLTIRYRSLTPIGEKIRMRAWIDRVEGRKTFIRGSFHRGEPGSGEERLCAEAEGIFIKAKQDVMEATIAAARQRVDG